MIDHIIVSKYGVFVVETKNMKGWIFGGERQKTWTQRIYNHKTKFQNPLHQNYKHTKTLEAALSLSPDKIFSVVVFVGDCTFKTSMPENVNYPRGYLRYIKSKTETKLTDSEVEEAVGKIEAGRFERSIKTHINHARHVKKIVNEKQGVKTCPKCGSPMVLRRAKKGANAGSRFWGCSNFPGCRETSAHDLA